MCSFNYRILKYKTGEIGIHEVFYNDDNSICSFTEKPVIVADNIEKLHEELNKIKSDVSKHKILDYHEVLKQSRESIKKEDSEIENEIKNCKCKETFFEINEETGFEEEICKNCGKTVSFCLKKA